VWKLAMVARGDVTGAAAEALLDSYEAERHPIALDMVRATERATRLITARNPLFMSLLRAVAPRALRLPRVADRLGRGVGMLNLTTGGRPRLPNPALRSGGHLHDRVDPLRPTLLAWNGERLLVRPDGVIARTGELPHGAEARVDDARVAS
jgi:hypothetical protein